MTEKPDAQAFLGQVMSAVPALRAAGIVLEAIGDGHAEMRLPYRVDLVGYRETGVLAGGIIFTLMDSVSGAAVFSALPDLRPIVTLDLRIDYLRPAKPQRDVTGQADCIKLSHHIGFVRGLAHDGDPGDPLALTSGTFAIKRARSERQDG